MSSKQRRSFEKGKITNGGEILHLNNNYFLMHSAHYFDYNFTANERDKFWDLRVMLALHYAIWSFVNISSRLYSLQTNAEFKNNTFHFSVQINNPSQIHNFTALKDLAKILQKTNKINRLKSAADLAWNLGIHALKENPTKESLYHASICNILHKWLTCLSNK